MKLNNINSIIMVCCGHILTCLCVFFSIGGAPVHAEKQSQASTFSDGHWESTSIPFQKT